MPTVIPVDACYLLVAGGAHAPGEARRGRDPRLIGGLAGAGGGS
jgi:hypothetical protein